MSIYNKELITQLTRDGLKSLIKNRTKKGIFQIFGLEKIAKKDNSNALTSDKYRGFISDGDSKMRVVFGNSSAKVIMGDSLNDFAVIQINDYLLNNMENKGPILIITDIDVIRNNVVEIVGEPQEWVEYEQNGFENKRGSNQIPTKYFKDNAIQQEKRTTERLAVNPKSQTNVYQSMQSQGNYQEKAPVSNSLASQLSKNNNVESMGRRNESSLSQSGLENANQGFGSKGRFKENDSQQDLNTGNRRSYGTGNTGNTMNRSMGKGKSGDAGGKVSRYNNFAGGQTGEFDNNTLIKQLVGFSTGFTIKAKISKKSTLRTYQKNGTEGRVFSIDLVDPSGEIQGSFFGEAATENYDTLMEGHVYLFTGGTVKDANTRFQTVKNDYQIMFDRNTVIEEAEDDGTINSYSFEFTLISQIDQLDNGSTIDVIAIIKTVGASTMVSLRAGGSKARRNVELCDASLCTVELTLWGNQAEEFAAGEGDVLVGRALKVSEFGSKKNLSTTTVSQLFNEDSLPKIPEVQQILNWRRTNEFKSSRLSQLSKSADFPAASRLSLEQIEEACLQTQEEKRVFDLRAYITYIRPENMCYAACKTEKCMKKVSRGGDSGWVCYTCNASFEFPLFRYILSVKIEDNSGAIWASVFNKEGEALLGIPAGNIQELKEMGQDNEIASLIKETCCHEWKIRLMAKTDFSNYERKLQYQIVKCSRVDFASESKSLLEMLGAYDSL